MPQIEPLHVWFFVPPQLPSRETCLAAVADGLAEEEVLVLVVTGRVDVDVDVVIGRVLVVALVLRVVLEEEEDEEAVLEDALEDAVLEETGAPEDEEIPHFPNPD